MVSGVGVQSRLRGRISVYLPGCSFGVLGSTVCVDSVGFLCAVSVWGFLFRRDLGQDLGGLLLTGSTGLVGL